MIWSVLSQLYDNMHCIRQSQGNAPRLKLQLSIFPIHEKITYVV